MSLVAPVGAATEVAALLGDLFIILLAAKLGDGLFKRIHQPALIGEILAGVLIGPAVLGLVEVGETVEVFAEIGVVFLLFWVGLETKVSDLREVGRPAALAGVLGIVLPFAGGLGLGFAIGEAAGTAMFLGAALVATSAGITSAVLMELGVLHRPASRTIIGAAIVDDILAMILLAVAGGIAGSSLSAGGVLLTAGLAVGFVAFFALGGTAVVRRRPGILQAPRFAESPLLPGVLLCLGLAALATELGLAAIIGALLAGMIVAETKEQHPVEEEVAPLYAFFPPFFFAYIGLQVDLGALADGGTLALLALVTAVAVITKFAGAWLGARELGSREAAFVGVGMVPRGEVGIIVASIGQSTGVIDGQLFAVVVSMSVITTLIVPPVLRRLVPRERAGPDAVEAAGRASRPTVA
jgi:Kef-type K+ transport system membrane component KefB